MSGAQSFFGFLVLWFRLVLLGGAAAPRGIRRLLTMLWKGLTPRRKVRQGKDQEERRVKLGVGMILNLIGFLFFLCELGAFAPWRETVSEIT